MGHLKIIRQKHSSTFVWLHKTKNHYVFYIYVCMYNTKGVPKKCIHILRDVIYVLLFEVELNYGITVHQMNASVTMRQTGN